MESQVKNISIQDQNILKGYDDPAPQEPEQVIPPTRIDTPARTEEEDNLERLETIKDDCRQLISDFTELIGEIDSRCGGLEVKTDEEPGSSLAQAMYRVFGVRSTNITYDNYTKALELQSQLSNEDREKMRQM